MTKLHEPRCRCENCDFTCLEHNIAIRFPEIEGLGQRVLPGELVPAGECPLCGALMHIIKPEVKK